MCTNNDDTIPRSPVPVDDKRERDAVFGRNLGIGLWEHGHDNRGAVLELLSVQTVESEDVGVALHDAAPVVLVRLHPRARQEGIGLSDEEDEVAVGQPRATANGDGDCSTGASRVVGQGSVRLSAAGVGDKDKQRESMT